MYKLSWDNFDNCKFMINYAILSILYKSKYILQHV